MDMPLRQSRPLVVAAALLLWAAVTAPASAQAYCALRDPARLIRQLFPASDSYRSIVRSIGDADREAIAGALPFTLHFNEIGRHTLYVAVRGEVPVGLVHVRSEVGDWGMVEIAWGLTVDLVVTGFEFQRCRSRHRRALESPDISARLAGLDARGLAPLLREDGTGLAAGALPVPGAAVGLAGDVVRSALKTIAVTRLVWRDDLETLQVMHHVHRAFADARRVVRVDPVWTERAKQRVTDYMGVGTEWPADLESTRLYRAEGDGGPLGFLVRTRCLQRGSGASLWWRVSLDGVIQGVHRDAGWPDEEVARTFAALRGFGVANLHDCGSAVEVCAGQIVTLIDAHRPRAAAPGRGR